MPVRVPVAAPFYSGDVRAQMVEFEKKVQTFSGTAGQDCRRDCPSCRVVLLRRNRVKGISFH